MPDDKQKCPIETPESEWRSCLRTFPEVKIEGNKNGGCPMESGTEPKPCVYDEQGIDRYFVMVKLDDVKAVLKKRFESWNNVCDTGICTCDEAVKDEIKKIHLEITGEELKP